MSLETMTKLASTTVGVGGTASVTFSNIPQGYTDLKFVISARESGAVLKDSLYVAFNNDYSTSYTTRWLEGDGASAVSASATAASGGFVSIAGSSATASVFNSAELYILNYSSNTIKSYSAESGMENNATTATLRTIAGIYNTSAPITSVTFSPGTGLLVQYSSLTLYGIKNAAKTAGNSIKATGGNIVFDGTYVYHVFPSTGAFAPTQPLTADVLVVAGGGGGGKSGSNEGYSGGGGAGGLRTSPSLFLNVSSYAITVGAGGAGASSNTAIGANGSSSSFWTIATTGGGGGASGNSPGLFTGANGGSGGGSGGAYGPATGNAGGYSPVEGYNGGQGNGTSSTTGGGGGAGGAGVSGTLTAAGIGGVGISTPISGGAATGFGENVSGTYYFAGGGGGTRYATGGGAGGVGGGGAGALISAATSGTANTGGGGGGSVGNNGTSGGTGGSGGSGIVIVRYKG